jgi:hypothetical protein
MWVHLEPRSRWDLVWFYKCEGGLVAQLDEALAELGVPDPTDVSALLSFADDLYSRVEPTELDDLKTLSSAARSRSPEFVALVEAASRAVDPRSSRLLEVAAAALPELRGLTFLETADVALVSPALLAAHARPLAIALAERVETCRVDDGLQAYAYLEVLTRLGLASSVARYRALELMSSVSLLDSSDFLERLPRLVGLALDHWNEEALLDLLRLLLEHEPARADAQFELGQVSLRRALEGGSIAAIIDGFLEARSHFLSVEAVSEAREDATIYRSALEIVLAFAGSVAEADSVSPMSELRASVSRRAAFATRTAMGGWATPRKQAEAEWYSLANSLSEASQALGQASWLHPVDTLSLVLAAYQASRSITVFTSEGLRVILEPAVEAAFIRREGLLAHLRDALAAEEVPQSEIGGARALLEAISSPAALAGGDALGKVLLAAPSLAAELDLRADSPFLGELASAVDGLPAALRWMNATADALARARARNRDPVVDSLLGSVLADLQDCQDLEGIAREEFVPILSELLKFSADRADIGRQSGGDGVAYLFVPADGKPFTEDYLQRDLYSWMSSSTLRRYTRMEERDVASGRADITVTIDYRFVVEIKRELQDASPDALFRVHAAQAAAYSVVGPRLSLECVLDLTDHSHGIPSLPESVWVSVVPIANAAPRHVVTLVVRGNRPTPRQMKTG